MCVGLRSLRCPGPKNGKLRSTASCTDKNGQAVCILFLWGDSTIGSVGRIGPGRGEDAAALPIPVHVGSAAQN